MDVNQNQTEISFEQLIEMSGFSFGDENTESGEKTEISLSQEEEEKVETKEEEVVEDSVEERQEEPTISLESTPTVYSELAKEKLASGEWEDVLVDIEGKQVKLSELSTLDEEIYKAVKEDFDKEKEEALNSKYVSIENLNETQKALINIIKSGDLEKAKELFEQPQQLIEPFQGYDSDNESHNLQVLTWFYKNQGHSDKQVAKLIEADKEELAVETKAEQVVNWQKNQFHEKIKQEEVAAQEAKKQEQEKIKAYRKDLAAEFKTEELSDTMTKKFVDVATKYNQEGELEIDAIYDEWMSDPKKAKDLVYFLLDNEGFIKSATKNTKREVEQKILKTVNIIRDNSKTAKTVKEEEKPKSVFEDLQFD